MISRFLDWLDESAAGVIRVAYLLAGVIAVASYFSDGHVPNGLARALDAALPWVLAGALEIHTYLSARRVRSAWQDMQASTLGSDEHEKAGRALRLNLWILGGLLAFSMYNQLQYLAANWTPPHTPLTPSGPFPYLIRAVITPAAFMAAAFLAPMGEGMAVQVQREAHNLARLAFKAAAAQWKRRLREMQQQQQDVTGALVGLVDDPSERKVIAGIWQAMHPGQTLGAVEGAPAMPALPATPTLEETHVPLPKPRYAPPMEASMGVQTTPDPDPEPDDDGPHGGGGLPARAPRPLHDPLVPVSPVKYPASARNGSGLAARQGTRNEAWDWQQLRDYVAATYDAHLGRAEALGFIKQCSTRERDAKRPGRPLVASRKQLEQRVRLALGLRGGGVPKSARAERGERAALSA